MKTHGLSSTREHTCWLAMRGRCEYKRHKNYALYGGRGITVCERWAKSFAAFYADVGPMPSPGMTLERIDRHGNYEPGNCRWATRVEQAANTSRNVYFEFEGQRYCLSGLARHPRCIVKVGTLRRRILAGIDIEIAMTTPSREDGYTIPRVVMINSKELTLKQAAEANGLSYRLVYDRLWHGWSIEDALTMPPENRPRAYRERDRTHAM